MNGCGQLCCILECQSHYYQAFFSRERVDSKCKDKLGCLSGRLIISKHLKQLTLDSETESPLCVCTVCVFGLPCLLVCVFVYMRMCPFIVSDAVETKHFWPASLPRCWDWFSGVTVVFCLIRKQRHKTVLSSTGQMVLDGVGSVYYGNRGQKVLSVE